jgi:hypothetical protein
MSDPLNNFLFNISPLTMLPEELQLIKCNTYYLVLQFFISIYASMLSWNTNKDTNWLLRIVYTILAFIFGIFYVYYHLIRYGFTSN